MARPLASTIPIDEEGSREELCENTLTIEILPEDVLLEIFDFCKLTSSSPSWGWNRLVHVCQRWRTIVFASQHRLDLRLLCTYGTPVRKTLDCWPPLPIVIRYNDPMGLRPPSPDDENNIIAALQHRDRVCEVELIMGHSLFAKLSALMQKPFPLLESLMLRPRDNAALVLPSAFLGGSAPRLCNLYLDAIALPALPAFLPSSRDLVCLQLRRVPGNRHITPDALVASLSAMSQLKTLRVQFSTPPPPYPTNANANTNTPSSPRPMRRVVLPALLYFEFRGTTEFLEDFVARIESAPSLVRTRVSFFNRPTFEIPQFSQFVHRMKQRVPNENVAKLLPMMDGISISISVSVSVSRPLERRPPATVVKEWLRLHVSCVQMGRQVPLMAQVCRQISPLLSGVRKLEIPTSVTPLVLQDLADVAEWVGLLLAFGGVEELHVAYGSVPDVARALQRVAVGERTTEVLLPALRELHFGWFASRWDEAVASFIAARKRSGHSPIAFHRPKKALV